MYMVYKKTNPALKKSSVIIINLIRVFYVIHNFSAIYREGKAENLAQSSKLEEKNIENTII